MPTRLLPPASTDRHPSPSPAGVTARERLAASAGWLVRLVGLLSVVSGLLPAQRHRLELVRGMLGLPVATGAATASVLVGILLMLVGAGLRRRQRRAWSLAVGLLAVGSVAHLVKGLDLEEAVACLAVLAGLAFCRGEFRADPDPDERVHPLRQLLTLVTGSVVAGWLLVVVNSRGAAQVDRLRTVLRGLVGLSGPVVPSGDRAADLVASTLLGLGVLTVTLPLLTALRTRRPRVGMTDTDLADAVRLLASGEPDSLGWFALRADKQLVLSRGGKAAVSYRVEAGVALASGDPLGDPEAWPGALAAFLELAAAHGWTPAVLGCSTRGGHAWSRAGFSVLELGDEALLDLPGFGLDGRHMRGVRQAVARAERAGLEVQARRLGTVPAAELDEVRHCANSWRDGPVERGFSMALGRVGGARGDDDCVLVTARVDGALQGLLHLVPWGPDGLSLDLMRRAPGAANGLSELLVVRLAAAGAELGVRRVSLNFAVFRGALERGARLGAGPLTRWWRALLVFASRYWQIDSLYRFNDKFGPGWEPRFLCYRRTSELPRVAVAALQAEAFLPRLRLRLPWT